MHGSTALSFVDIDNVDYNKYESKIPSFYETIEEDFYLCSFRIEAALENRELAATLC